MSFEIQCQNCGALSSPSVGICPYCKAVLSGPGAGDPTFKNIKALYEKGDLNNALSLAATIEKESPESLEKPEFVLLYSKILFEAEAPSSKLRALLQKAQLKYPENQEILEYLELVIAKGNLSHGKNDSGELSLKNILMRSPSNVHAAFLLGSHLFWVEKDPKAGLIFLEKCVKVRPNFLRALACLATVYRKIGAEAQAVRLYKRCVELESDQGMKALFVKMANGEKL